MLSELLRRFLVDHVGDATLEHSVGRGEHIERLSKQDDLAIGSRAMTEETLMDLLSGNPGLLVNGILPEGLIRRIDVNLHVNEPKARIHLFVQKSDKSSDVFEPFISRLYAQISEVR